MELRQRMWKEIRFILIGLFSGLLAAALILIVTAPSQGDPVILLPTPEPAKVTVYVTGAVENPGVYQLPPGSRVEAAIQAAGGWKPSANQSAINLAQPLEDGQSIYVPLPGEKVPTPSTEKKATQETIDQIVDINSASVELLDQLPGIGPTKASEIVSYRQNNGAFDTIEEILNVPGIGPGIFEDIRDLITVSSPTTEEGRTDEPQRIDQ